MCALSPGFQSKPWAGISERFQRKGSGIERQEEDHKGVTFQDEYRAFLKAYGIAYDERYVWD